MPVTHLRSKGINAQANRKPWVHLSSHAIIPIFSVKDQVGVVNKSLKHLFVV